MTGGGGRLMMVRGTVTTTREQMHSVRVNRKTGYGRINKTPEMWLRDAASKKHRYQGCMFEAALPGHEVAVISKQPSGKPVAFANFTTGMAHDGADLNASTSFGTTVISTFGLSLLLALPGLLFWGALLDSIGLRNHAFTGIGLQLYAVTLITCAYAGLKIWSKGYRERSDALRQEIARLLTSETARANRT